jgi:hypothetical protein
MTYSKWLWDELFFLSYHFNWDIRVVKTSLSPIERRFFIDKFIEQREKEHKEITQQTGGK